jgi:hypothetical protein
LAFCQKNRIATKPQRYGRKSKRGKKQQKNEVAAAGTALSRAGSGYRQGCAEVRRRAAWRRAGTSTGTAGPQPPPEAGTALSRAGLIRVQPFDLAKPLIQYQKPKQTLSH